MLNHSKVDSIL